jgi:hypothetical protein
VKRHCRSINGGNREIRVHCALSTRTHDTVPSRPMTASIGTTP